MKLRKTLLSLAAAALLVGTAAPACVYAEAETESETGAETQAFPASEAEAALEKLADGWNYSALYFTCPVFDIINGTVSWNEETKEWEAQFTSPYLYTVLRGTINDDGTLTLTEDNANGYGGEYLEGLGEELQKLRDGREYAFLEFSAPDFDLTDGAIAWNESTGEWKAEFPSPYKYTKLAGTFTEDGKLTITEENTGGYADPYIPGLEEAFADILAGNRHAPIYARDGEEPEKVGTVSWNKDEMTWTAVYEENELSGSYAADGTLTLGEGISAEEDTLQAVQDAFILAQKGIYGNSKNLEASMETAEQDAQAAEAADGETEGETEVAAAEEETEAEAAEAATEAVVEEAAATEAQTE